MRHRQQILDDSWEKAKALAKAGNDSAALGEILRGFLEANDVPGFIGFDYGREDIRDGGPA